MNILGIKPGHDGSICLIADNRLLFSLEGEKDSFERHAAITPSLVLEAAELAPSLPDVIALSGWHRWRTATTPIGAGYLGVEVGRVIDASFFGRSVKIFSSSHERSHLLSAAALAPGAPLRECVILVWEGTLGAFYHWTDYGRAIRRMPVIDYPGTRYAALFGLADPTFPPSGGRAPAESAGKLMALAGYSDGSQLEPGERRVVDALLALDQLQPFDKQRFAGSALYDIGVHTEPVHRAARYMTDRLFDLFLRQARAHCPKDVPLLIAGGCGLNCEWNRRWRDSTLFSEVFVPPCANDSGSAIGTAMDAAAFFGEECWLEWDVYAGAEFRDERAVRQGWESKELDFDEVARILAAGGVVAWVQGRYEMGPRALGHRSLLASPLLRQNRDILNEVKRRENYRPIAPACLSEDLEEFFDPPIDDPFMLYFSHVKTSKLPAVTHVDGTARVQSVHGTVLPALARLLKAFKRITGCGAVCNTSLNFPGRGFINNSSDLFSYCEGANIANVVVNHTWYRNRSNG